MNNSNLIYTSENYLASFSLLDLVVINWPLVRPIAGEIEPLPATIQSTSGPIQISYILNSKIINLINEIYFLY